MKRTAFITGILGQDGAYLSKFLLEKDYRIYGLVRRKSNPNFENLDYFGITNEIEYLVGDVTDEISIMKIMKQIKPNEVYNLAAQSFVGISWENPKYTLETNFMGALNILEAIISNSPKSRFYQASTSEMFGISLNSNKTQDENTPFHPRSPYGVSKLAAHWITVNYRESYGIFACSGILMNHESPLRGKEFVTRKITNGIARIISGEQKFIELGNLDVYRDWGYAGDFVEAMWLMLQQSTPEDYVIATGESHSLREFLEKAFLFSGLTKRREDYVSYVKINPLHMRPAEVPYLRGNPKKAKEKLGWSPKVSFDELVRMMVNEDIRRNSKKRSKNFVDKVCFLDLI